MSSLQIHFNIHTKDISRHNFIISQPNSLERHSIESYRQEDLNEWQHCMFWL